MNIRSTREQEKTQRAAATAANTAQAEAVREMLAFVEENRVRLDDISVKRLIHEGHGP